MLVHSHSLSILINLIIHKYFSTSFSTCILWNKNFDIDVRSASQDVFNQFVHINPDNLDKSFEKDVYNFKKKEEQMLNNGLNFTDLIKKLTVAIEHTNCESFVAFQEDIPIFAKSFRYASTYSLWRSQRTKFLFVLRKDIEIVEDFHDLLFQDQPSILIVEAESGNSTIFDIKTNKFVGSVQDHPEQLYLIDRFDSTTAKFEKSEDLYKDKITDLKGREVKIGVLDYTPFVVLDYEKEPQVRDWSVNNKKGKIYVDGTEIRILITFCEKYNCTIEADSTYKDKWGVIYPNATGDGCFGEIARGNTHFVVGGVYFWYFNYMYLDTTAFIGRSGVTCMVPKPTRAESWNLPFKPFQYTLWMGILICLVVETSTLMLTWHYENSNSWFLSFSFAYSTTLRLLISQNSTYFVNANTIRVVLFSCYVIDIIITSVYGGGLATFLTIPSWNEAPDSVERLHKFDIPLAGTSIVWISSINSDLNDPFNMRLLRRFEILTVDEMRKKAETEYMGFMLERMIFGNFGNEGFLSEKALDRLKLMVDDLYYQYTTSAVPRLWALLSKYNDFVYSWHSSGFDKFWEWKVAADSKSSYFQKRVQASRNNIYENTGPVRLDLNNFVGLILVWVIGMVFSILGFFCELLWYKTH